ncbi:hypothetical protein GN316_14425 [Xylophilus sp. Kf1]|nr:hypothetical protein [Xylophilus sp. Kf1]
MHRTGSPAPSGATRLSRSVRPAPAAPAAGSRSIRRPGAVLLLALLASAAGVCLPAAAGDGPAPPPVFTRAVVRSVAAHDGKTYAWLKILPRARLPFTTQALRVPDPALVEGLHAGDEVGFSATHRDGENTLVAIHKVAACVRFRPCPPP